MKETQQLKDLYKHGYNIMKFFRDNDNLKQNTLDAILHSYDLQSGSYIEEYYSPEVLKNFFIIDGIPTSLTTQEAKQITGKRIADILSSLKFQTFLEVGTGEATTICDIFKHINGKDLYGLDLSLSRLLYAKNFAYKNNIDIKLCLGNMFQLPFLDSSIDIVFTYHCIEPNTNHESDALQELYRVAKKYLILIEPSYELGNEITKKHIIENCYIKNLKKTIDKLGYTIENYELFSILYSNNNSALYIIKKDPPPQSNEPTYNNIFACPNCGQKINMHKGNYFCPNCNVVYPIISEIPILNVNNAILCSKYLMPIE